jgi:hypothetical protein
MKHASAATLVQLEPLLLRLRTLPGLVERKPGIFYRQSAAFLHFHEDPSGLYVDVKLGREGFERLPVGSAAEQAALWQALSAAWQG